MLLNRKAIFTMRELHEIVSASTPHGVASITKHSRKKPMFISMAVVVFLSASIITVYALMHM